VLVGVVTVGTNHEGHEAKGAANEETVPVFVPQVGQLIAPVEATIIGDVPLNPALPMLAIGIAAGISETGSKPPLSCGTLLPVLPRVPNAAVPKVPPATVVRFDSVVTVSGA
jgi:hypothetical protein